MQTLMVFSTFCSQAQLKDNHNPKVPAPPMQKLSQKSMLSQLQPVILIQEILSFKQGNCTVYQSYRHCEMFDQFVIINSLV